MVQAKINKPNRNPSSKLITNASTVKTSNFRKLRAHFELCEKRPSIYYVRNISSKTNIFYLPDKHNQVCLPKENKFSENFVSVLNGSFQTEWLQKLADSCKNLCDLNLWYHYVLQYLSTQKFQKLRFYLALREIY